MQTIALLNLKGGVGKTSIAVNLAAGLQILGETIALVDMDPQQSATRWNPEGLRVEALEGARARRPHALKAYLEALAGDGVTVAILDLPPELEDRSLAAAMLADVVAIPSSASVLDVWATELALEMVRDARTVRADGKPRALLIPSRVIGQTVLGRELPGTLGELGDVAPGIGNRVAVAEAAIAGKSVSSFSPGSQSDIEFRELARYVRDILVQTSKTTAKHRSK